MSWYPLVCVVYFRIHVILYWPMLHFRISALHRICLSHGLFWSWQQHDSAGWGVCPDPVVLGHLGSWLFLRRWKKWSSFCQQVSLCKPTCNIFFAGFAKEGWFLPPINTDPRTGSQAGVLGVVSIPHPPNTLEWITDTRFFSDHFVQLWVRYNCAELD